MLVATNIQNVPKDCVQFTPQVSTGRDVNESAVREFALKCSAINRAGKFDRMGSDFFEEVVADIEGTFRKEIRSKFQEQVRPLVDAGDLKFITGNFMAKIQDELNAYVARLIQNKVQKQPSTGCTLRRTR